MSLQENLQKEFQFSTLIFEGAGWEKAESADVGNCRIRTRIKTNNGQIVYLEMGCTPGKNFYNNKFNLVPSIYHCHHENRSFGSSLRKFEGLLPFEYNKANILSWVNKNLNCSFTELLVDNNGIRVHDTKEPLCSSI